MDPFSPYHQTTPFESFDHGPTSLVLAGYKWVVARPLCVCSTTFYICLLLLPRHFCCSCHVSFYYVSLVFVLILYEMKGMGLRAYIVSSYFLMGLCIGLTEIPTHSICWAFALIAFPFTMPIGLLAVISTI